ncbi:hypothetical protein TNCV_3555701 [Trichonephila clavipes]|nr:hypothetical protein TNCV_3555701 [Trichonephila clavipes]
MGLLVTDLVILNLDQMTITTPDVTPSPFQANRRALSPDRFYVHQPFRTASLQWHWARTPEMPATRT